MGSLVLPTSGLVYVDAQVVIYSVEKHPTYSPLLRPLWQAVQLGTVQVVTSELTVLEVLAMPLKRNDGALVATFEQFFLLPGIRLVPIAISVLRDAAQLRAALTKLRSPDAIRAATAAREGCQLFVTNDFAFRAVTSFPVAILDDVLASP